MFLYVRCNCLEKGDITNKKIIKKESARATDVVRALIGGGYLLSHFRSTIGVVRFNFSVRNGKRWSPHAIATLVRCGRPGALLVTGAV